MHAAALRSSKEIAAFHQVPALIYRDDANYIPHLRQDIDKLFDPKRNKLLVDGAAERWVFYNDGQPFGRVAAFINPKTAQIEDQPTGGIGFFECIDSQSHAAFIFDTAKAWLAERGMEAMDGPINFGERNQFWGCLTKNFTDPNSYAMNYNPAYYPTLFERYGFGVYFEQYLYKRLVHLPMPEVFKRKMDQLSELHKITVRNMDEVELETIAAYFLEVYNGAWGGHAGFKAMTMEGALKVMKALKPIINKNVVYFAFAGTKPIGFFINIPELNELFKYLNGNLNWWGKIKFLYYKTFHPPKTMVGIVFGVVREWHRRGVEGALIFRAGEMLVGKSYQTIVMTWVGDFNPKMIKVCENLGAERYREMKTYRYLFDRNKPFERCRTAE